jgi:hypothetical protein
MKASLETSNGICVTFYNRFDPAIAEVPHEPGQSFPTRRLLGEESKTYALDFPAHEIPSSHNHRLKSGLMIISDRSHAPARGGRHPPYGATRAAEEACVVSRQRSRTRSQSGHEYSAESTANRDREIERSEVHGGGPKPRQFAVA